MDDVPIEASEAYFNALVSMRKPAQLVRYWGEGHGNRTPANIRGMHHRVFTWFDEWGDITRDGNGDLVFDGPRLKSRGGAPALAPDTYAKFARQTENGAQ